METCGKTPLMKPLDWTSHERKGASEELEDLLKSTRLIRWAEPPTKVDLGVQVTLLNLATEETVEYTVVAGEEVGVGEGRISINSPLGQALAGRRVGARATLADRPLSFRILALRAADGTGQDGVTRERRYSPAGSSPPFPLLEEHPPRFRKDHLITMLQVNGYLAVMCPKKRIVPATPRA